jgi:ADP-ribose pyrophosphatase
MQYEQIETETIFRGRVFNVRQDRVRLPDGRIMKLDIVDHPVAVVIVPVDADGNLWFIHQYRHAAGSIMLELPAGVAEAGEAPEVGAGRETQEEIGMAAGTLLKIGEFFIAPGYTTEYLYIFLATQLTPAPLPQDEDEFITVERIPIKTAYALAEQGKIIDAKTLAALLLARPHLLPEG